MAAVTHHLSLQRCQLHIRDFQQKLRARLFFIELIIFIFILIYRQRRKHLNPEPAPALQPAPQSQPQPSPKRKRKPPNPWVMPWILQRQEKGCYSNLLAHLTHTNIPGYQNFVMTPPAFFTSSKNAYTTALRSQPPISGSP